MLQRTTTAPLSTPVTRIPNAVPVQRRTRDFFNDICSPDCFKVVRTWISNDAKRRPPWWDVSPNTHTVKSWRTHIHSLIRLWNRSRTIFLDTNQWKRSFTLIYFQSFDSQPLPRQDGLHQPLYLTASLCTLHPYLPRPSPEQSAIHPRPPRPSVPVRPGSTLPGHPQCPGSVWVCRQSHPQLL